MKTKSIINPAVLCLCSFAICANAFGQGKEKRVGLAGNWKFILGDNMKFAHAGYDDSDWEDLYVPAAWQDEGFRNYFGYAWYRKTVEISFGPKDNLYLELGSVDDVDEVYLNGQFIGRTGGFPPDYYTAVNYPRRYPLPAEYLKQGKNVIAVRVYDEGGAGGIVRSSEVSVGIYNYTGFTENSINLFGKWKFHLSDNPAWSAETVDESGWEDIVVPSSWEAQGFKDYDGFAWYRKTFKLPDNFKRNDLVLILGKIDDMDEVFINGKLIGGTGPIEKKWASNDEYSKYRTYFIEEGLLRPGKNNVIAVRVYDQVGAGGIYEGPITLLPRNEYKQFWKKYRTDHFDLYHWFSYYFD
jgi:sialate O-acetylesterase